MQTRSSLQRRSNSESSDRVVVNLKPRSWGDEIHEQPQTVQPQNTGFDFKNADWFSHDPGPRSPVRVFHTIQAKLKVGAPNDQYEQEADSPGETLRERAAKQVVSTPDSATQQPIQQDVQTEPVGYDFSHVDWFSHDPGPRSPVRVFNSIQAKLKVGAPNDVYEQEADRVAEQVMSTPDAATHQAVQREDTEESAVQTKPLAATITPLVQRDMAPEEEEDPNAKALQGKLIQREAALPEEEEDPGAGAVQGKLIQRKAAGSQAQPGLEQQLDSSKGGGTPLPEDVRAFMEPRFGADFSQVRVHTGSEAVQMNRKLEAQAFTHDSDIYYGSGKSPGNNDLTAHELTHVVQQTGAAVQRQGTDGVLARRESLALQMRSHLRTSSLSKLMIQRAVATSGGEWDTDQYDLVKDTPALGVRGVDVTLKFTPGDSVDAELIGLTQSVQAFVNNAPNLTPAAATRAIPSKDAIGINTGTGETDEGTAIDQSTSNRNPLYAAEGAPAGDANLADTLPVAGDATKANTWGKHGFRYKDKGGAFKTQSALLIDKPRRANAAKDSRHIFEATALAIKGSQAGTYYGSVRWGWRTDSKGNFTKIFPLEKVSDGVPSSTFMKAAEIWNAAKTSTGADTLDLPVVDVKITTAPMTGVYPAGFVGPPLSIPAGTRVQIIRNAIPPRVTGQIKVVDGVSTGNTLEVTFADMANLKDERA